MGWNGDSYQQRFDELASQGRDVHGEVDFVMGLAPSPASVLDAGCGTGRVAIELARRGVVVVGVDCDPSMLSTARRLAPELTWAESDLADLDLGQVFDVVIMAGNVVLFTAPGTESAVVAGCGRHIAPGGALVAGFQLGRDDDRATNDRPTYDRPTYDRATYDLATYDLATYDRHCRQVGLQLEARWATWDRGPWPGDGGYGVSVHRRLRDHRG